MVVSGKLQVAPQQVKQSGIRGKGQTEGHVALLAAQVLLHIAK